MKGIATIQLFDAETGDQVFEHKEENMVTDAISKVLSPRNEWVFGNTQKNILGLIGYHAFPLYSRLLGGVLLFNDVITESANTIMPKANLINVGYAGGEYGGSNQFRGSYNTNESGPIANGYRHVWDFGTDKVNTTIRSICLTSLLGGNSGWRLPSTGDTDVYAIVSPGRFTTADMLGVLKFTDGRALLLRASDETKDNEYICFRDNSLYSVKEVNLDNLKITSMINIGHDRQAQYTTTKLADLKVAPHNYTYISERIYYMEGKFHHVYSSDGAQSSFGIMHDIYNLDGTLDESRQVVTATSFYGRQGPMFYYRGKYFVCTTSAGTSISIFSSNGTLENVIQDTEVPTASTSSFRITRASFFPQTGHMLLTQSSSSDMVDYMYAIDENFNISAFNTAKGSQATMCPVATEDDISPYVLFSSYSANAGSAPYGYPMYLGLWTPYLGTINNLATAVTKTSGQTMKIVYSVYDD